MRNAKYKILDVDCLMKNAESKMRITVPCEIVSENMHFAHDVAWFSNSHLAIFAHDTTGFPYINQNKITTLGTVQQQTLLVIVPQCTALNKNFVITLTPYMVLPLLATRFADYAGGIRVSFIQPRLL